MKISVIVPVYNCEKYIEDCLNSIMDQVYRDFEIIIVDDGSTDSTPDKIIKFIESNDKCGIVIRYVRNIDNCGIAKTLNQAIKLAFGDYIKWISADDMMYPTCLTDLLTFVDSDENKKETIFYTHYDIVNEQGLAYYRFEELSHNNVSALERQQILWKNFYGNGSSTLIHKNVFHKAGLFDESMRFAEDYEFWLRATIVYDIDLRLIPIVTIKYRNHPEQTTHKIKDWKQVNDTIRSRIKLLIPEEKLGYFE